MAVAWAFFFLWLKFVIIVELQPFHCLRNRACAITDDISDVGTGLVLKNVLTEQKNKSPVLIKKLDFVCLFQFDC